MNLSFIKESNKLYTLFSSSWCETQFNDASLTVEQFQQYGIEDLVNLKEMVAKKSYLSSALISFGSGYINKSEINHMFKTMNVI